MLTAEELREQLDYDPLTGVFMRQVSNSNRIKRGDVAGTRTDRGYRTIRLLNGRYMAHRLAWLYVYGDWPAKCVDHINGVRDDNRIANLREATFVENGRNMKKRPQTRCKLKGVSVINNRFRAQIGIRRKVIYLGIYDTEEEAHAAYVAAAEKEFGAFARAE
jgi:hypothetical protein